MGKKIEIKMSQDKVTKGAIRYGDGNGHTIYLRKEELPDPAPKAMDVTLNLE